MNWRLLIVFSLIISLSGAKIALANDQHGSNMDIKGQQSSAAMKNGGSMAGMDMRGNMPGMDMSGGSGKVQKKSAHDMLKMKNGGSMPGMDMKDSMPGMDMGGPVKETPPNMKVLGTFGMINFIFIGFGIWTKFFRRNGDFGGLTK